MMTAPFTKFPAAVALVGALAISACEQPAPGDGPRPPEAAPKTATAPGMDIDQPITARGTEPFWALHITDGTRFRLTRPDQPDLTAEAPGAAVEPGRAAWVAQTSDGRQMTVALYRSPCSDGMSDIRYPMTAEVVLPDERLSGCAAKTDELSREGG